MMDFINQHSLGIFLGSIGGGVISAIVLLLTWLIEKRTQIARELLSEALAIQSEKEAWILEGFEYETKCLSELPNPLPTKETNPLWLRKVELRAVLDRHKWNTPNNQFFGIIQSSRTWIIRDKIIPFDDQSYPNVIRGNKIMPHPAIVSSKGIEDLCGWIERAASLWSMPPFPNNLLSKSALKMLWPLAVSLCNDDRIEILEPRLTKKAVLFLRWYQEKYGKKKP